MRITILASGSNGNSILVEEGDTKVLVDAGLSAKKLSERLESIKLQPTQISAVVLTHEHSDHSKGINVFCGKNNIPVFCNILTWESLGGRSGALKCNAQHFINGGAFRIGDLEVVPFSVPHDAADPVGFTIRAGNASFGVLTDLGHATHLVVERARGVQALFIETNHDEQMLSEDTKRPWAIKQRIMSRHGHLSNRAAADVVAKIFHDGLRHVALGHLSQDCNREELAIATMRAKIEEVAGAQFADRISLVCATQESGAPTFEI